MENNQNEQDFSTRDASHTSRSQWEEEDQCSEIDDTDECGNEACCGTFCCCC